jgi:hypothetical protein
MSAPKLPACPVPGCRRTPMSEEMIRNPNEYRFRRHCTLTSLATFHEVSAYGRTQAEADARWCRLAGGQK